jgi:HEAT repeat protein
VIDRACVKRQASIYLYAGGLVSAGLAVYFLFPGEPVHHGKRLSAWVADLHPRVVEARQQQAELALRAIGTNAVPYLLELLRHREPRLLSDLRDFSQRTKTLLRMRADYELPWVAAVEKDMQLSAAFAALGPSARPAFPALTNLLLRPATTAVSASALARIGPDAFGPLSHALSSPDREVRAAAAGALGSMPGDLAKILPELRKALGDSDKFVRINAVIGFGQIAETNPEAVLDDLIRGLRDTSPSVKIFAADSLARLGKSARPAVPELVNVAEGLDRLASGKALSALKQIDPEAAAKLEAD